MEKFWSEALKITGVVAIPGFLLWYFLPTLFSDRILEIFNSEQVFTITLIVICSLLVTLFMAIRWHFRKKHSDQPSKIDTSANIHNSRISGDFVMGDKIQNKADSK